jgi:glutamate dehydrogenase/leucine dehydrogenase
MQLQKLASTDGFIVYDLDDAPAVGVVRLAPKVLRDGAELLARSTTYLMASYGLRKRGASAAINAKPDGRDAAVAAFVTEVQELAGGDRLLLGPGLGVTPDDLADLPDPERRAQAFDQTAAGESGVAAALGALGSLDGARVAIVGNGPVTESAAASVAANGGTAQPQATFDAECDVLLVAGKAGILDHDHAATVRGRAVVPLTSVPVTARALAVLGRADVVVVPDFLSTAAPLLAAVDPDGGDAMERVHGMVADLAGEGTGMWMAAALRAEDHLRTWQPELPFGRPLA